MSLKFQHSSAGKINDGDDNKTEEKHGDIEPIFDPQNDRVNLLPIRYPQFWEFVKEARASFWLAEEIDFSADMADWDKLTPSERQFLEANFSLFLMFDQIVIKNLETDFVEKITIPEIRTFYRFQEMIEDVHIHVYALFPINFIKDETRLRQIQDSVKTFPILGKMEQWCKKWITNNHSDLLDENSEVTNFTRRLVAFILIEGIIFSGSFAAIFYMKKRQLLPAVCQSNEFIARDEALHTRFGIALYHFMQTKLTDEEFIGMLTEIVNLSIEWCSESISVALIGMSAQMMSQYIQFVADQISSEIIGRPVYKLPNPFPWMNMISLQGKTNFFDRKVTQYTKPGVFAKSSENQITFDAEF